ncbi:MAG: HD domain-containing protein [Patescibacteria group bacterium]
MSNQKIETDEIEKIIQFFLYSEGLKTELRDLWLSSGEQESTAEHSWRMALMVMIIVPKLTKLKVNLEKTMKIALIHDLVEIDAKDTPLFDHFDNDDIKADKKEREERAMRNIEKLLGTDSKEISDLWHEYEDQTTDEARVVKAIDKLEGRFQYIADDTKTFSEDDLKKFPAVRGKLSEYCSIDPFLAQLDKQSTSRRKPKERSK